MNYPGPVRPPVRTKNLDLFSQIRFKNHQETHLTSLLSTWGPLDAPFTPWDLLGAPLDPLGPLNTPP